MSHKLCLLLSLVVAALYSGCQACQRNKAGGGETLTREERYQLCLRGIGWGDGGICPPPRGIITLPSKHPWIEGTGKVAIRDAIYDLWALDPRLRPIMKRGTSTWTVIHKNDKLFTQMLWNDVPDCIEFVEIFVSLYDGLTEREKRDRYRLDYDCRRIKG